jgi:outer membrane protein OmpA-like peptidoglycan-associated protein
MKKIVTLCAAALMAASASAQALVESKTFDNIYIGVNGGVGVKTTGSELMDDINPNAGLRIGRYFTPVFGLAVEGNAYFSCNPYPSTGTAVKFVNTSLLGTVNLSNWFGGYPGRPRTFELTALYGLGWGHLFTNHASGYKRANRMTSKAALDFAFNLGASKAWQIYIEPSMTWAFEGSQTNRLNDYHHASVNEDQPAYNINNSMFQLNAGIVYKFSCSNGTHNFKKAELKDQATIDALNAKVNSLREEISARDEDLQAKDREIADLVKALKDCKDSKQPVIVKQTSTTTNLLPTVIFRQGRSSVDPAQFAQIELIASYMKNHPTAHVEIKGYASPEGSVELNQKLSEDRAKAVRDVLVNRYGIAASRLTTVGCGPTSTLFEQVEFNRVATFNDNTK